MSFEVILEDLYYKGKNPFHFLKYAYKHKIQSKQIGKLNDLEKSAIKFLKWNERSNQMYRNTKTSELPLEYFKREKVKDKIFEIDNRILGELRQGSSIIEESRIDQFIQSLIPNSFMMKAKFKLTSPYFSRDDDDFYVIDNPIVKEKAWKVPMIRPSAWKGAFFKTAIEKIKEKRGKDFVDDYFKVYRIFGVGSDEFRQLSEWVGKEKKEEFKQALMYYTLFELGERINPQEDTSESLWSKIMKEAGNGRFVPHKGRGIFYPTYFNRLSLEIINPHNRRTKAGTQPIYYEVVPKDTGGVFQLACIPYDAILLREQKIREQAEEDAKFLVELLKVTLEETGVGAKTKLGWGRAKVENKDVICKFQNRRSV